MSIVMNMSSYEVEREEVAVEEYGDEIMCAGWNPQLALAVESPVATVDRREPFPGGMAQVDIDSFLQKMYKYQC